MNSANLIAKAKEVQDDGATIEIVVWQVPQPLAPCTHTYKYRLYFGKGGQCRIRYDNERGKGDHRHVSDLEEPYVFKSLEQLLIDFQTDIENWSAL
jgi:hypothetical protein